MNKNIKKHHPLLQIVKKYILYLQFERRLSINTSNSYYTDLKKYVDLLFNHCNVRKPNKIYKTHINKYLNQCLKYLPNQNKKKYKLLSLGGIRPQHPPNRLAKCLQKVGLRPPWHIC